MFKVEAYKCSYCGKLYDKQEDCEMHERYDCKKNVNAFNCRDCVNHIKSTNFGGYVKGKCRCNHKISAKQFENCPDKKFIWELVGTLPPMEEKK